MNDPTDLSGITRKRYWLIARILFIGCKPKQDAADCVLQGIDIVGIMFQLHRLDGERKRLIKAGQG